MISFLIANIAGILTGVVLKTLVPMPFVDEPIRDGWAWVYKQTIGRL